VGSFHKQPTPNFEWNRKVRDTQKKLEERGKFKYDSSSPLMEKRNWHWGIGGGEGELHCAKERYKPAALSPDRRRKSDGGTMKGVGWANERKCDVWGNDLGGRFSR